VHVYVIDTGVRTSHVQFLNRTGLGYASLDDGNGVRDCHGHGTHVAGTIAGALYGVARGATIHPVRVLDACGYGDRRHGGCRRRLGDCRMPSSPPSPT
jgi:subtilisin family serine protease